MKKDKRQRKERRESRFPKIYILDVIIILLIVAIGLGIYFRYSLFDLLGNSKVHVETIVSYSIDNIKDTTSYYIDIDDKVYIKNSGEDFGTIIANSENSENPLSESPATEIVYDYENREYITVSYPSGTRIDAKGRIKCSGIFGEDGAFMLNGSEYIAPGQKITVCTEKVTVEITVLDIQKVS